MKHLIILLCMLVACGDNYSIDEHPDAGDLPMPVIDAAAPDVDAAPAVVDAAIDAAVPPPDAPVCAAVIHRQCNGSTISICVPEHGCGSAQCNGQTWTFCDNVDAGVMP